MKIGLVRRGYSPTGGAERYLQRFAEGARAAGHELLLFADAEWPPDVWSGETVRVRAADCPRRFADAIAKIDLHARCDVVLSLERIWRCDAYRAGDGVHAVWMERRRPFEPFWRSLFRKFNGKHRALLELERSLFSSSGARLVVANSHMVEREIVSRFQYPPERIRVIYNGVPASIAPPGSRTDVRAELGFNDTHSLLLFAGSGWERKGLRFAIQAVHQIASENVLLLIAGTGNRRALPNSNRVRFLGARSDLPRLFAAADAFLLPTHYDPFSNASLEALAAGLPVITTRYNGASEIIAPDVHGEIIEEPDDIAALTRAIEKWAAPERRSAARHSLQEHAAHFSVERNSRETLDALHTLR